MERPADHPAIPRPRIGVLLVNLGTPDAPDVASVRRYLKQFLSDRRVVEIPPLVWQPILNGFVLTTRPRRSAEAYQKVWTPEGSPLLVYTRAQAEALRHAFGPGVIVDFAMRYGNPPLAARLQALQAQGCDRILLAPLYPQYSAATTATVQDEAFRALEGMRWQPALRTLPAYFDDSAHIAALATSIETGLAGLDFEPQAIVTSFHGMPERTLHLGDPYHCQCRKTARLLGERLGREVIVSFQSRFGRAKWLEPYTDATLAALPGSGITRIVTVAPGFAADCLETLEELAMEGRDIFLEAGGERFAYLPCLNASEVGVAMLKGLIERELAGWAVGSRQ